MPTAIVVLSDARSGSDDALGRVFNALAGADHPAHELFEQVRDELPSLRNLLAAGHTVLTF